MHKDEGDEEAEEDIECHPCPEGAWCAGGDHVGMSTTPVLLEYNIIYLDKLCNHLRFHCVHTAGSRGHKPISSSWHCFSLNDSNLSLSDF